MNEVNAKFKGFDFNIIGGNNLELMLEEDGLDSSVHISSISDGTLRYLCLLAILYNPERGKTICIDEPEVGLHPDMIRNIANALKTASIQSTLIIATHSIELLNCFNVENLRVFEKTVIIQLKLTDLLKISLKDGTKRIMLGICGWLETLEGCDMADKKILFIEGTSNTANGNLREGFSKLLEKKLGNNKPKIKMGNGKQMTIDSFLNNRFPGKCYLLVDLDGIEGKRTDDLKINALDNHSDTVYYMVQEMESWFLSQPNVLDSFYGKLVNGGLVSDLMLKKKTGRI